MEGDSDFDFAYKLQVEEALTASLLDSAAATTSPTDDSITYDAALGVNLSAAIQNDNLQKYEQILLDQYNAEAEARRLRLQLIREIHDRVFSCEIMKVPEGEWAKTGDYFSRPFGEGTSTSGGLGMEFRVYVKGLVEGVVGAIAAVICDDNNDLMFEMRKGFSGKEFEAGKEFFQFKALVEALEIASALGLKRILILTDSPMLFQIVTGKNPQTPADVTKFSEQIRLLLRNFSQHRISLEATEKVRIAYTLAINAVGQELERSAASSSTNRKAEKCSICLEDAYADQMHQVPGCRHSYCFSCMMKHVQFKLLVGVLPKCPHENCKSELTLDECKKFLTPELFDIMSQRVKEASIPVSEKIYCPNPRCSALLSKTDMEKSIDDSDNVVCALGGRNCPVCGGVFCLNCKVPWHRGMNCSDFRKHNPQLNKEDTKLKSLATNNRWRQCPKCNHMISLAEGCYHIYCRCGHEFCYTCGAEWKNKKATCKCPVWDERNIVY